MEEVNVSRPVDYWVSQLQLHQEAASRIRNDRRDAIIKIVGMKDSWFNGLITVCFGLGAALIALGANFNFINSKHQVLFWIATSLLLSNGIYLTFYRKIHIEEDGNKSSIMALELEYYIMQSMQMARDALQGKPEEEEYDNLQKRIVKIANDGIARSHEEGQRISVVSDLATNALVISFYLLALSLIHMTSRAHMFYLILGIILIIILLMLWIISYKSARKTIKEFNHWQEKIKKFR